MDLSVVVPTLNGRDVLAVTLDALGAVAPDAEVVVVNGPSTDGTSGMVRDHDAADVLVEVAERNINAGRNAGIAAATGDVVAFVGEDTRVEESWLDGLRDAIEKGVDVVTGPTHREVTAGVTTETMETRSLAGRDVRFFDGGNVAFTRAMLDSLDGFDEYLTTGGARDAAHRVAGMGNTVAWRPSMSVLREERDDVPDRIAGAADGPVVGIKYCALAYRLAKNYGPRPTVVTRTTRHAILDAFSGAKAVLKGDQTPSSWFGEGRAVVTSSVRGTKDGLVARAADRSPRRNPNGISSRDDRAVETYDLRRRRGRARRRVARGSSRRRAPSRPRARRG
ncbi:glycosyltransferase family 2 protein [Halobacteriaceae archaeon GCM10025711]